MRLPVSIVNACVRDGRGGSPTAVLNHSALAARQHCDSPSRNYLTDAELRQLPTRYGTSHAVILTQPSGLVAALSRSSDPVEESPADLRFFTAEGELPACGHGTVAALAWLARQRPGDEQQFRLRVSGRTFSGRTVGQGGHLHASFDPGPLTWRAATTVETGLVRAALRLAPDRLAPDPLTPGAIIATLGRARMLLPVRTLEAVTALVPDFDRLRTVCDQLGLLGCYVHSTPTGAGQVVARMFAPSIGVPEDIANANSTACLAAVLADQGVLELTVDLGDALGRPATVTTSARLRPNGVNIMVGGFAIVTTSK